MHRNLRPATILDKARRRYARQTGRAMDTLETLAVAVVLRRGEHGEPLWGVQLQGASGRDPLCVDVLLYGRWYVELACRAASVLASEMNAMLSLPSGAGGGVVVLELGA
jgi:hypothetical protein